eukprot:TRINITY_DN57454_c0_g1_i1.p1 TRINITY_DN57454_c0_g1~~TRINITY_DN57454_c0_g1_i1.p1  ORF type:complete len:274 (-),score=40.75 TRINITY_DN57454_c0_g1_i1:210-977(-)
MVRFEWPEKDASLSRELKEGNTWRDEEILVLHEALRWLNRQLSAMIKDFDPHSHQGTRWKTDMLFDWIDKYWSICMFSYHEKKVRMYNPFLKAHGAVLDDILMGDSDELLQNIDRVAYFREEVRASKVGLDAFKSHVGAVLDELNMHLAEEETEYPKAFAGVSEKQEKAFIRKLVQALGFQCARAFLPILVYTQCMWRGQEKAFEWLKEEVPFRVRLVWWNGWLKDFKRNNLGVIVAVSTGRKPSSTPRCTACVS